MIALSPALLQPEPAIFSMSRVPTNSQFCDERVDWKIVKSAAALTASHSLTPREREILSWVAKGQSAKLISEILNIAKRTVDEHVQTASRKLGATNRAQAVAIALLHRLYRALTNSISAISPAPS